MLLDTHALVWLALEPTKLSNRVKKEIDKHTSKDGLLYVCSASFWEIAVKINKKKVDLKMSAREFQELCSEVDKLELVDTSPNHWIASAELEWKHKDPIDRLIVATATQLEIPIITKDKDMREFYEDCLW